MILRRLIAALIVCQCSIVVAADRPLPIIYYSCNELGAVVVDESGNGSELALYLDGVWVSTTAHAGSIAQRTHPVALGNNSEASGRFYEGLLDDGRIYSRVLTDGEILHLAGRTGPLHGGF